MIRRRILFIGDSLIAFFDWQARFPGHEICNLGVGGETVEGLLARVGEIVRNRRSPDFIFVMVGINNIAMQEVEISVPYREVIEKLSGAYPRARIYIHSILPTMLEWIPNESIRCVNSSLQAIAAQTTARYLNLYEQFIDPGSGPVKRLFLSDGIHLSSEGYDVWSERLEEISSG